MCVMKRILLIEDDPQFIEIYKLKLLKLGHSVQTARNVPDALMLLQRDIPDMVLLDILLEGKEDGFCLLQEMKTKLNEFQVPVIVLTNLPIDHEKTARSLGAREFFIKAQTSINQVMHKITTLLAV